MSVFNKTTIQPLVCHSMSAASSSRAHIPRSQAMDPAQSNSLLVFEPSSTPHIPSSSTTTPTTPYPLPTTLISYTHLSSYNLPHSHTLSTILRHSTSCHRFSPRRRPSCHQISQSCLSRSCLPLPSNQRQHPLSQSITPNRTTPLLSSTPSSPSPS